MPTPPASFIKYDFSDPSCYPGSGTNITDLNSNLNGSITGSPTFVSNGQQSYFNITSDSQKVWSDGYNFPTKNIYTISAIFQVSSQNNFNTVLSLAQNNGNGTTPFINVPGNHTSDFNFPGSSNGFGVGTITGNIKLQNDTWNLLTLTADGTTQKLYLNGILIGSVAHTNSFNGTAARLQTGYPDFIGDFAIQKIAIMQMWQSALTAEQVSDLAESYRTRFSLYQPLVKYDFSESACYSGSGNTVYDLAASNNSGLFNSPVFSGSGNKKYFDFSGPSATPSYLNRTGQITGIGTNPVMSMNIWLRISNYGSPTYEAFCGYGNDQGGGGIYTIWKRDAGVSPGILSNTWGSGNTPVQCTTVQPLNEWVNLCCTTSGTASTIYQNGAFVAHNLSGSGFVGVNDGGPRLSLGTISLGGYPADSDIAYFELYNTSISPTDVLNIYNAIAPRFDNLVAKYDLNSASSYPGTGNTLYDLSENGYDITLTNTSYITEPTYNSLEFLKGSSSKGTFSGSLNLGTSNPNFSFLMWVKPIDLSSGVNFGWFISYGKESAPVGGAPMILGEYSGSPNLSISFGSGVGLYSSGVGLTIGEWACLTSTCDGTTHSLYLNGSFLGSVAKGAGEINTPEELAINYLTQTSVGYISYELNYLEIYDKALTSGEITTIYNNTVTRFLPAPSIVGGRQFAQGFNG